ncbi:hypothetical protein Tco_0469206 [Tanacetum coccineum]
MMWGRREDEGTRHNTRLLLVFPIIVLAWPWTWIPSIADYCFPQGVTGGSLVFPYRWSALPGDDSSGFERSPLVSQF